MTRKSRPGTWLCLAAFAASSATIYAQDPTEVTIEVLKFNDGTGMGRSPVRDSKHTEGPGLAFSPTTWSAFLPYASEG
ncbi:hypothetical protein SALBM311S_04869 [Streptomyces alboniger]